jgi:hypothetical protein
VIASDLAAALDPVLLARQVGLDPDAWQTDVLRSTSSRLLLNASRQSGKSTTVALLNVHTALYRPGSLCLMLSPTLRQSGELFRKAAAIYHQLGRPVPSTTETSLTLTLANGSRIVSLPGQEGNIRGYSAVDLLSIDEASRVPDPLYTAARPMLATTNGRLVALSTPFGTRGWWYEAWRSDQPWERYEIPAAQCPRISPDFLEQERLGLGPWWYDQEYNCRFLDAQSQAFGRSEVDLMFAEAVEPWHF